ncbi:hypothetical protein AgCh_013365 [Apium graveolens]
MATKRYVDRSKIRCFNCDELGYFATECRKPKKVKKDKAYLELEAKYEDLLRKQQGKTYIAEGKSWDDSDNDNYEEVGNYALMALEYGESSSSKIHVPTFTTIDLNESQYKETVEKMSIELFHIHTSMVTAIEEVRSEIEVVLREKIENSEVKLKSFRNASQLVGQYHDKNKPCANISIGLDYDALNSNKKVEGDKGKAIVSEDVSAMLKKQEIADEDKEKKCTETTPPSKTKKKPMVDQTPKKPIMEVKTANTNKKKKNRNRKIGINKSNNFAFVADAPRKQCQKCGSVNHLTHLCKKVVSNPIVGACKYNEANADDLYSFCDKFDCIPCNIKVMTSCYKLRVYLKEVNFDSSVKKENEHQSMNSILSGSSNSTSTKSINNKKVPNTTWVAKHTNPHCVQGKVKKVIWIIDSGCSRHMTDVALVADLEVNLLSVSQFTDRGFNVLFDKGECLIISKKTGETTLKGAMEESLFVADLDSVNEDEICCFYTKASEEQSKMWHKKALSPEL